eukprot:SAG22_NODE_571_length_9011_cov_292.011670_4_plen_332_part_00
MSDTLGFHNFRHTQSPKLLFVDSRDAHHSRLDGKAEFTYVFNQAIHNNPGEGVLVSLLQASIPYSFYNIRAGSNDSLKITAVKSGASADYTITVPAGNYTVTSLAQKLKEDIETQMDDGETNVTITYDRITNKYKFAIGPASGTRSLTIHGATSSDLTQVIGLTTEDFTFDNSTASTAKVTPNVVDMNGGIHALYLRTNLPVLSSMDSQTGGISQILAKVPILDKPGSVITHSPSNSVYKALIQTEAVRAITLRLTDDRNSLISLNGLHFSVSLMFEFVSLAHRERTAPVPLVTETKETPKKEKKKNNRRKLNPKLLSMLDNKDAKQKTPK